MLDFNYPPSQTRAVEMAPESEMLWRELLKHAGPSSEVPVVDGSKCCDAVGLAGDAAEKAQRELLDFGAIAHLTDEQLEPIARRKKLPGDFIRWEWQGATQFLRVVDPDDIRMGVQVAMELLRREDTKLMQREQSLPDPKSVWMNMWSNLPTDVQEQATGYWNARIMGEKFDVLAFTYQLRQWDLEGRFQSTFHQQAQIRERRNQIAKELERLSARLPKWARESFAAEYRREPIPKAMQQEVWRRDQGRCVECGSKEKLEFDHIIPVTKGGATTVRNLQLLCEPCNRSKNNRI